MKTFGDTLRELMTARRISVGELAKAINQPVKSVQEWTNPKRDRAPRDYLIIKKIAEFLNVSVHFLLYGEEDPRTVLPIEQLLNKTEIHTGLYEIVIRKVSHK